MSECRKSILNGQFVFLDKSTVVCNYCSKPFKYHNSTSTLQYHLRNIHPFTVTDPQLNAAELKRSQKRRLSLDDAAIAPPKQPTTTKLVINSTIKQERCGQLTSCIARWIAQDCRPVNVVEDGGLQKLIRVASGNEAYTLPSRKMLTAKISSLYESEKAKIRLLLENAKHIALTTDYWTNVANESFLGVTGHFLDKKWAFHTVVLGVYAMEEQYFADAISQHISCVIDEWMLSMKVTTLGTDNGFNMINSVKQVLFDSLPCTAHALQLSMKIGLDEAGLEVILDKCRKIVGHFKHSFANFPDLKTELSIQPTSSTSEEQEEESTCWNSTFNMIENFLNQQETLLSVLRNTNHKHNLTLPTETELDKLRILRTLLEPCKKAIEILGGNHYVSCSVVLPCHVYLTKHMKILDEDPAYIVRFKTAFCKNLEKLLTTFSEQWLKIAVALDPRFKKLKCLQKEERDGVWFNLEREVAQLLSENFAHQSNTKLEQKKPKTFDFLSQSDSDDEERGTTDCDAHIAVERYKLEPEADQDICPFQWWISHSQSHPLVAVVASKFLSSPATTVPCERLFSISGHALDKKRASLSSSNLNEFLCLHSWLNKQEVQHAMMLL